MSDILRFFEQYEGLIYLLLAIGGLVVFRVLWQAWRTWRVAVFALEKEIAFQQVRMYGVFFLLLLIIAITQFCMVTFIAPFIPALEQIPTPTINLLTPAATDPAATAPAPGEQTPPTATSQPLGEGCVPGQVNITSPALDAQVKGIVVLTGTVDVPNLGFYRYEYAPLGSEQWITIAAGDMVKKDEELGSWDTSQLAPGDYRLRLLASDNAGNNLPACIIPLRILAP